MNQLLFFSHANIYFSFLVGAFINKRAGLLQSLVSFTFFKRQTRSDEIFVQFVQLNEYLGNASKLSQRFFQFSLFKRNIQNRMRLKGPFQFFFRRCGTFFRIFLSSKGSPFDFIEARARNIRSKTLYPNF